jgi:hypothetical protein
VGWVVSALRCDSRSRPRSRPKSWYVIEAALRASLRSGRGRGGSYLPLVPPAGRSFPALPTPTPGLPHTMPLRGETRSAASAPRCAIVPICGTFARLDRDLPVCAHECGVVKLGGARAREQARTTSTQLPGRCRRAAPAMEYRSRGRLGAGRCRPGIEWVAAPAAPKNLQRERPRQSRLRFCTSTVHFLQCGPRARVRWRKFGPRGPGTPAEPTLARTQVQGSVAGLDRLLELLCCGHWSPPSASG